MLQMLKSARLQPNAPLIWYTMIQVDADCLLPILLFILLQV